MPEYIFIGKLRPEWIGVKIDVKNPPLTLNVRGTEAEKCEIKLLMGGSDLSLVVTTDTTIKDIATFKNQIKTYAKSIFDVVCLYTGQALQLDLTAIIIDGNQFGIFKDYDRKLDESKNERPLSLSDFVQLTGSSVALRSAISDLKESIVNPNDTPFYCYRAVESIRQSFKNDSNDKNTKKAWEKLRKSLRIEKSFIDPLVKASISNRHGSIIPISSEERSDFISRTTKIIDRFSIYLSKECNPLLDSEYDLLEE